MVLTPHLLIGGAIGSKIKNYWAIFIIALISHFVLDAIPHWEYVIKIVGVSGNEFLAITVEALLDILIGVSVISLLLKHSHLAKPALVGAFFAILPDGFIFVHALAQVFFDWNLTFLNPLINFHHQIHFSDGNDFLFWRIITETAVTATAILLIWRTRRTIRKQK